MPSFDSESFSTSESSGEATVVVATTVTQVGEKILARAADSWAISKTGLGDISDRSKLWFAINSPGAADLAAKLFIEESAGLTVVNGEPHTTTAHGDIIVNDEDLGDLIVTVDEAVTALLSGTSNWAIKMLTTGGDDVTLATGVFSILKSGIKAIT